MSSESLKSSIRGFSTLKHIYALVDLKQLSWLNKSFKIDSKAYFVLL